LQASRVTMTSHIVRKTSPHNDVRSHIRANPLDPQVSFVSPLPDGRTNNEALHPRPVARHPGARRRRGDSWKPWRSPGAPKRWAITAIGWRAPRDRRARRPLSRGAGGPPGCGDHAAAHRDGRRPPALLQRFSDRGGVSHARSALSGTHRPRCRARAGRRRPDRPGVAAAGFRTPSSFRSRSGSSRRTSPAGCLPTTPTPRAASA
jgi:hypothetical protein